MMNAKLFEADYCVANSPLERGGRAARTGCVKGFCIKQYVVCSKV